jgi:hypothetical protein
MTDSNQIDNYLVVLLAVYYLLLEKKKIHVFNRVLFVVCFVFSMDSIHNYWGCSGNSTTYSQSGKYPESRKEGNTGGNKLFGIVEFVFW